VSLLRRGVNIVLALLIVAVAWGVVVWLFSAIPGTPHSEIPHVIGALMSEQSDESLQRFLDHGSRVQAWNAVATALLAGVAIGVASRKWLHLRVLDIAVIVIAVALFKGSDYALCCVDRWDFIGPILLGVVTLLAAGVNRAKPPNSRVQPT
jgi:asparagine N-glycosylation enzyme membrane subunit Stt3